MEKNSAPLLEMRNIKKDFFGNQVLTDINLTLNEGEVLGLVGENGAGKSTLMKILFGMDVIRETGGYSGEILLGGQEVKFSTPFDALEAGIGMVHQEFSLIPGFTATENILLNREPTKTNVISQIFGNRLDTLNRKEMDRRALITMWQVFSELEQIEFLLQLDETDEKDQAQLLRLATECQRHFTKGNTSPLPARFEQSEPGDASSGPDSASDLAYVADRYLANARAVSEAFARFA